MSIVYICMKYITLCAQFVPPLCQGFKFLLIQAVSSYTSPLPVYNWYEFRRGDIFLYVILYSQYHGFTFGFDLPEVQGLSFHFVSCIYWFHQIISSFYLLGTWGVFSPQCCSQLQCENRTFAYHLETTAQLRNCNCLLDSSSPSVFVLKASVPDTCTFSLFLHAEKSNVGDARCVSIYLCFWTFLICALKRKIPQNRVYMLGGSGKVSVLKGKRI